MAQGGSESGGGELKPFKIGDMQRPGPAGPARNLRPTAASGDSETGYAFIEDLFDRNDFEGVIALYDRALERLKPIALESADATKKREAHKAIRAYDRAMELLTRMLQVRQEMEESGELESGK